MAEQEFFRAHGREGDCVTDELEPHLFKLFAIAEVDKSDSATKQLVFQRLTSLTTASSGGV